MSKLVEEPQHNMFIYNVIDDSDFSLTEATVEQIKIKVNSIQNIISEEKSQLCDLLLKYKPFFNDRPECHRTYMYKTKLTEDVIVKNSHYPIPYSKNEAVIKELQNSEKWGVTEKSSSPHSNVLHVVYKADGGARPVSLRNLNKYIEVP